jgi:hypothetical protein
MNKADWMTACAAMVGVVGIGLGVWWLGRAPGQRRDTQDVAGADWIQEAAVRMRDTGHVFNVEVLAVPVDHDDHPIDRAEELTKRLRDVDWKVQDVVVALVRDALR